MDEQLVLKAPVGGWNARHAADLTRTNREDVGPTPYRHICATKNQGMGRPYCRLWAGDLGGGDYSFSTFDRSVALGYPSRVHGQIADIEPSKAV